MLIRFKVPTTISSGFVKSGEEKEVDSTLGKRLCSRNIAEEVYVEHESEEVEEETIAIKNLDSLSVKELFNLCKEEEIKLDKEQINGKTAAEKKEYMISKLNGE